MVRWHKWSGAICVCVFCVGLVYEVQHLRYAPIRPTETTVVIQHTIPPHYEQVFMPGPPAELWRTAGATSNGAVGTFYQVINP